MMAALLAESSLVFVLKSQRANIAKRLIVSQKHVAEYTNWTVKGLTSLMMSREALADKREIASLGRKYPLFMSSKKPSL